ncbi:MAG: hypothetical protein WCG23_06820 [bacterium]
MRQTKLLKLVRMMSKFTSDDVSAILEIDEETTLFYLSDLENKGIIKKITGGRYIHIPEKKDNMSAKTDVKAKPTYEDKKIPPITPKKLVIDITKDEDYQIYLNAPAWAKKKADKYLAVLEASGGLGGEKLKFFIKQWNKKFPEMKTSRSSLLRARNSLLEGGVAALLAGYTSFTRHKSSVKEEIYKYFKEFYLSFEVVTMVDAINRAKEKYFQLHPDSDYKIPSYICFRNRILREFTREELKQFRTVQIKGVNLR